MNDLIKIGVGLLFSVAASFIAYYVRQVQKDVNRVEEKQDKHEEKDDKRFAELTSKVDDLKKDMVDKRHAFRAEMRDAFDSVHERGEKMEERLRAEITRMDKR